MTTQKSPLPIAQLQENSLVDGIYLVRKKNFGTGKTGKSWIQLQLGDQTGTLDGRIWDNADQYNDLVHENDLVHVKGRCSLFMGNLQLKISDLQTIDASSYNLSDFLPQGKLNLTERRQAFMLFTDTFKNPDLKNLYLAFLDDDVWLPTFLKAPAAKSVHHAYIGGLSEHTLSMMQLADLIANHYQNQTQPVDRDLLVLGAFLHDLGKTQELSVDHGIEYTTAGRLLGHITQGIALLNQKVVSIANFPAELNMQLQHMILSHHGEYALGSPRRPKTIEAMILHFIDNLDARVEIFQQAFADQHEDSDWTAYVPALDRHLYRPNR